MVGSEKYQIKRQRPWTSVTKKTPKVCFREGIKATTCVLCLLRDYNVMMELGIKQDFVMKDHRLLIEIEKDKVLC